MKFLMSILACVSIGFCLDGGKLDRREKSVTIPLSTSLIPQSSVNALVPPASFKPLEQLVPPEVSSSAFGGEDNSANAGQATRVAFVEEMFGDSFFASPPRSHVIQVPVERIDGDSWGTVET